MTDVAGGTWYRHDLPVLRAVVNLVDGGGLVYGVPAVQAVARETGLTEREAELSIQRLLRMNYLTDNGQAALSDPFGSIGVTREAYRLVGRIPDPEADQRERLIAALEDLSERLAPEDAAAVRGVTGQLRGLSRDALAAFVAAVAAGQVTG